MQIYDLSPNPDKQLTNIHLKIQATDRMWAF